MSNKFTEWGALLLQEEINAFIRVYGEICEDLSTISIHAMFEKINWILKILSIDSPADMKRYNLPSQALTDDIVRNIMTRRCDLSKDAIGKIKLNFICK